MKKTKEFRTRCLGYLFVVALEAFPAAAADTQPLQPSHLGIASNRIAMSNMLAQAQQGAVSVLERKLFDRGLQDMALKALWPTNTPPQFWISGVACKFVRKAVWMTSQVCSSDQEIAFGTIPVIERKVASDCILRLALFDALCQQTNHAASDYLIFRASKQSTVGDILLAGRILWGDDFTLTPQNDYLPIGPHDTREPNQCRVTLPKTSSDFWKTMFQGHNDVYRWLAMKNLDAWIADGDLDLVLAKALRDPVSAIGVEAVQRLKSITDDRKIVICGEYIDWLTGQVNTNDYTLSTHMAVSAMLFDANLRETNRKLKADRLKKKK